MLLRTVTIPSSLELTWDVMPWVTGTTRIELIIQLDSIVGWSRKCAEVICVKLPVDLFNLYLCPFVVINLSRADTHNFDATHIPPEWHGWMTSQNDCTPAFEQEYMEEMNKRQLQLEKSDAPYRDNVGHQEPYFNFNSQHNQAQMRSRGYGIGNPIVGLPPFAPSAYYTQPGSPYNPASIREFPMQGSLDANGGRAYKSEMWRKRLMTADEKEAEDSADKNMIASSLDTTAKKLSPREQAILARGGTLAK